jgi:cell division protein ZapA
MSDISSSVQVEIFGQVYTVRSEGDPAHVERLAARVDSEMRQVSRGGGVVDSMRVAVLAALNITDECLRLEDEASEAGARAARMAETLAKVVEE